MKKTITIVFLVFLGIVQTNAQVTFKPGIRGGANFSHFTKGDVYDGYNYTQFSSKTDFYIGLYGELKLAEHYTMQPEIDYSNQGSNFEYWNEQTGMIQSETIDITYLSLALINKFTFEDKFNIHVGPTLDFIVDKNSPVYSDVDMAFVLGLEYDFTPNLGIDARVKKGIIPILDTYYDYYDSYHTNVVFSVGAKYTFDVK